MNASATTGAYDLRMAPELDQIQVCLHVGGRVAAMGLTATRAHKKKLRYEQTPGAGAARF